MLMPSPPSTRPISLRPTYTRQPGREMRLMVLITDSLFGPYFKYTRSTFLPSSSADLKFAMKPSSFKMRAISSFSREAGTSSFWWRALCALRMRVIKSATGSVKLICHSFYCSPAGSGLRHAGRNPLAQSHLPGRLCHPGYLTFQCQPAKTQAAQAELAHECPRAPAQLAAALLPGGKLRLLG